MTDNLLLDIFSAKHITPKMSCELKNLQNEIGMLRVPNDEEISKLETLLQNSLIGQNIKINNIERDGKYFFQKNPNGDGRNMILTTDQGSFVRVSDQLKPRSHNKEFIEVRTPTGRVDQFNNSEVLGSLTIRQSSSHSANSDDLMADIVNGVTDSASPRNATSNESQLHSKFYSGCPGGS